MQRCFNYTRCLWRPFRVYIYPTDPNALISPVYEKILRVLRESVYATDNPTEACLFVLSADTTDRDRISDNYVKDLSARIAVLDTEVWDEGRNHLIFNFYYGTYPNYSLTDIGFDPENALIAWASGRASEFRDGYDISLPLFHAEHPLRAAPVSLIAPNADENQHLVTFKGKRYVYGIGSQTRDRLYHLHDAPRTIIATTCRHNTDWKRFEDARCERDNREYDNYNYTTLLENSAFCLTPRGRRLGSFRFLEALRTSCIPVVLSDGLELPFAEIIDLSKAIIVTHEESVFFTTEFLARISSARIERMKLQAQRLYHLHFSSVEKIVMTAVETIKQRLRFGQHNEQHTHLTPSLRVSDIRNWNSTFTAIIQASKRFSSRLNKVIMALAQLDDIKKFIVFWPKARGQPPEDSAFQLKQQLVYRLVDEMDQRNLIDADSSELIGDFVLTFDERFVFNLDNARLLMKKAIEEKPRLVTFHALDVRRVDAATAEATIDIIYVWSTRSAEERRVAIGLLHTSAFPKRLLTDFSKSSTVSRALRTLGDDVPQCSALIFNLFIADRLLAPPTIFTSSNKTALKPPAPIIQALQHYKTCLNKLIRAGYEEMQPPFLFTHLQYSD